MNKQKLKLIVETGLLLLDKGAMKTFQSEELQKIKAKANLPTEELEETLLEFYKII